jgi:hypothetical protein
MRTAIVITDVTRMQEGRVCIAGYDRHGRCIRPVLPPPGIHERMLYSGDRPIIFPSAKVEFEFVQPVPQPPHTEDVRYDPTSARFVERQPEERWRRLLAATLSESVQAIFGQPILNAPGHYVMAGCGPRSLGTIQPHHLGQVIYDLSPDDKWQYRLSFVDGQQQSFRLTITDLRWRYYCDQQRNRQQAPREIAASLLEALQSREVYLRIGLARGWAKYPDRCYIQLTGVYTQPDFFEGRTFADFASCDR